MSGPGGISDRSITVVGAILVALLCIFAVVDRRGDVENGAAERARTALDEAGVAYDEVTADGRAVTVRLFEDAASEDDVTAAISTGFLQPVRSVDIERGEQAAPPPPTTTTEPPPPTTTEPPVERVREPELAVLVVDGAVTALRGRVGSPADTEALSDAVGPPRAWDLREDETTKHLEGAAVDTLAAVVPLLADGTVTFDGAEFSVDGTTADQPALDALVELLSGEDLGLDTAYELVRDSSETQVAITEVIELQGINFGSGTALISPGSRPVLDQIAEILTADDGLLVTISGHTDSSGNAEQNLVLSLSRADAVALYLAEAGVDPDALTTVGHGDTSPIADNSTLQGRAANRRIEFEVSRRGVTSE